MFVSNDTIFVSLSSIHWLSVIQLKMPKIFLSHSVRVGLGDFLLYKSWAPRNIYIVIFCTWRHHLYVTYRISRKPVGVNNCTLQELMVTFCKFSTLINSLFKKHFTDNYQERKDRLFIKLLFPPSLNFIHIWNNLHTN